MKIILSLLCLIFFSTIIHGQTTIRLSQIEPIQGTVIKSQGEASGKVLTTNGTNGSIWQTPLWQPQLNGTGFVSVSGTTISYVPANTTENSWSSNVNNSLQYNLNGININNLNTLTNVTYKATNLNDGVIPKYSETYTRLENSAVYDDGTIISLYRKTEIPGYNTVDYKFRVGNFVLQPYAINNAFVAENAFYSSTGWKRIDTGFAEWFQLYNGTFQVALAPTGSAGSVITKKTPFKAEYNGAVALGGDVHYATGTYSGSFMLINASGNVGINTVYPTERLEVNGNVKIGLKTTTTTFQMTTGALNGYFMKSDASGNGSWSDLSAIYEPKITGGTNFQYYRGDKTWSLLQTGNVPESFPNEYFTNTRARAAVSLTTFGTNGAATYTPATGVFNIPDYTKTINGLPQMEGNLIVDGDWFPIWDTSTGTENKVLMSGLKTYLGSLGMVDPMTTRGDIIYRNSGNVTARLPVGSNTFVLTSNGTDLTWALPAPNLYFLPLAANGTRGGVQIGYVSSDNDFALKLSLEKGYVSLPDASTTTRGIASFATSNFSTSYGYVSVKTAGITADNLANGAVGYAKLSTYNVASDGNVLAYSSGVNSLTWTNITGLPSQATHSGKYLTTNGTTASWATVPGNQWTTDTYGIMTASNVGIAAASSSSYELEIGGTGSLKVQGTSLFSGAITSNGITNTNYYATGLIYTTSTIDGGDWIRGKYMRFLNQSSSPSAIANEGNVFTKTDNKIYFKNYAGTEFDLTNVVEPFRSISATTTLATTDKIVLVTTGGITITYPTVPAGKIYTIRNTAGTAITVPAFTKVGASATSNSIAGLGCYTMVYSGSGWFQIN